MSPGMKIGIDVVHLHRSILYDTARDSDDLLRNITTPGAKTLRPAFSSSPTLRSPRDPVTLLHVCMCVRVCLPSACVILLLSILFVSYTLRTGRRLKV